MSNLIIFDMDGTLFRTETVDVKAINSALHKNGFQTKDESDILEVFGYPLPTVFKMLTNSNDKSLYTQFCRDVAYFEQELIPEFGQLYDGIIEMLTELNQLGFTLCICSNGGKEYISSIVSHFDLKKYFDDIRYCVEGISKSESVAILKNKYEVNSFVMVGDRKSDIDAAKDNGGVSIGVAYGFGKDEVLEADYMANSVLDVKKIILNISCHNSEV